MNKIERMLQELCPEGVEYKKLGDVVTIKNGKDYKHLGKGNIPLYGSGGIMAYVDDFVYETPTVLIPRKGSLGNLFYVDTPFWNVDTIFYTVIDTEQVIAKFLYYVLLNEHLEDLNKAGGVPSLTQSTLNKIKIPVPPLPIQEEIVRILDHFTELTAELQAELQARQEQYKYYKDQLLKLNVAEYRTLGSLSKFRRGSFPQPYGNKDWYDGDGAMPFVQVADIADDKKLVANTKRKISSLAQPMSVFAPKGSIIISLQGSIGKIAITQYDAYIDRTLAIFQNITNDVLPKYFVYQLERIFEIKEKTARGSTIKTITKEEFTNFQIPIPSISEQKRIVSILDKFETLVNDLSQGLPAEITAVQEQYEYYRNKLLMFNRIKSN